MKFLFDDYVRTVTPCLCAGAKQDVAEVRAPSIRGELRWWFRVLGGSRQEERNVFGGLMEKGACSSKITVRVFDPENDGSASKELTSNQRFFTSGRGGASISAGKKFRLQIIERSYFESKYFDLAFTCILRLGSIGTRITRGCGALQSYNWLPNAEEFKEWAVSLDSNRVTVFSFEKQQSYIKALELLEEQIKTFRNAYNVTKNGENALGFVKDTDRQKSCLRIRPVLLADKSYLPVMIYSEAALGRYASLQEKVNSFFSYQKIN